MQRPESDAWILDQIEHLSPARAREILQVGTEQNVDCSEQVSQALLDKSTEDGKAELSPNSPFRGVSELIDNVAKKWRIKESNPRPEQNSPTPNKKPTVIPDESLPDIPELDADIPFSWIVLLIPWILF